MTNKDVILLNLNNLKDHAEKLKHRNTNILDIRAFNHKLNEVQILIENSGCTNIAIDSISRIPEFDTKILNNKSTGYLFIGQIISKKLLKESNLRKMINFVHKQCQIAIIEIERSEKE